MTVKGGPKIVSEGLVFHLDAAGASIDKGYNPNGLLIDYLVVGGGGGGSGWGDGVGGGAGGFLRSNVRLSGNTYSIVVGAGGNRGTNSSSSRGSNGGDSQFGAGIIAYGGGGAGCKTIQDGLDGGSGGGGYGNNAVPHGIGGSGVPGQGNDGGDGTASYRGGSGGGAGESGFDGVLAVGNLSSLPGAKGRVSRIDYNWRYYAGGGGTGGLRGDPSGGLGGGGKGGIINQDGTAGAVNTGGGGGGGGTYSNRATFGGSGGSGIVIIRYRGKQKATGGDTIVYKNGYTIHTFTSSGSFVLDESVDGLSTNKIVGTLTNMDSSNFNSGNGGYFGFNLDGTNEYIDLPTINVSTTANTVCAWARKANTDGGFHNIYTPWSNGFDNWLGAYTNKWFLFVTQSADTGNVFLYSNSTITANIWYFVCSTIDVNVAKIYVNGELNFTASLGFTIGSWNAAATIGRRATISNYYWEGNIASISVYNHALPQDKISDLYNATKGRYGL